MSIISMRILGYEINRSRSAAPPVSPKVKIGLEIGDSGTPIFGGFIQEEYNSCSLTARRSGSADESNSSSYGWRSWGLARPKRSARSPPKAVRCRCARVLGRSARSASPSASRRGSDRRLARSGQRSRRASSPCPVSQPERHPAAHYPYLAPIHRWCGPHNGGYDKRSLPSIEFEYSEAIVQGVVEEVNPQTSKTCSSTRTATPIAGLTCSAPAAIETILATHWETSSRAAITGDDACALRANSNAFGSQTK
jgi:hypothetical protein